VSADPAFLLRLAEANLARRELEPAAAALAAALQRLAHEPVSSPARVAALALAERLHGAVLPGEEELFGRLNALILQARGELKIVAPPPALPPDPLATSSQAALVLRRIVSSPDLVARLQALLPEQDRAEPSLPLIDVLGRLLAADLDISGASIVALDLVARATGATQAQLVVADAAGTRFCLPGHEAPLSAAAAALVAQAARARSTVAAAGALAAPVLEGSDLVATIVLEGPAGRFGPRERSLVEALAGLAAPGLARARRAEAARVALEKAERALTRERAATRRLAEPLILGKSAAVRALRALVERVASTRHAVLIEGESGTGKELVARLLHASGDRAEAPFVAENVAALGENLAEAELFGHVRGAFTGADADRQGLFQQADGGTLFLDEIGDTPPSLQAKLLRVLEAREVRPIGATAPLRLDVRVVAATNRDLAADVAAGRFREDLFHRLAVVRVRVPPLRERLEDLPLLLEHFLSRGAGELGQAPPRVAPDLLARLAAHPWPGNVRELQAWTTRYVLTGATTLDAGPTTDGDARLGIELRVGEPPHLLRDARAVFDRLYIAHVLRRVGGNVSAAAKLLDMNRSHLSTLVSRFRLRS
jgi:DNA-binding NtrC family response regulator